MWDDPFRFNERTYDNEAIHAQIGRALGVAVIFEQNFRALQSLVAGREAARSHTGPAEERDAAMMAAVEKMSKRWLGTRPKSFAARYRRLLGPSAKGLLEEAVHARNELAHEIPSGLCDGASDRDDWREYYRERLPALVKKVALGNLLVSILMQRETNEPVPTVQTLEEYPTRAVEWVLGALD